MLMRVWRWLLPALAVLWGAVVWTSTCSVPVGLSVSDVTRSCSVSIVSDCDADQTSEAVVRSGMSSLPVSRNAGSFRFVFKCGEDPVQIGLRGISFFGFEILPAELMAHFEMHPRLYSAVPRKGEPLRLSVKNGDALNLPNVFPAVLRILRMASAFLALFPFALWLSVVVVRAYGKELFSVADSVLSRPWAFVVALVIVTCLALPNPVTPASPGLDSSWVWLFNRFAFTGMIGRDFVFTYGPLGFAISPQLTLANVLWGIGINASFSILFAVELWYLYRGTQAAERLPVYLLLCCWLLPWQNGMEWKWCLVSVSAVVVGIFACDRSPRARIAFFAVAAMTAGLQSFIKFSNCITVVVQQLLLMFVGVFVVRKVPLRAGVIFLLALVVSFLLGAATLFPSWNDFLAWGIGSIEIAAGYNAYMGGDKPLLELLMPFVVATVVLVSLAFDAKHLLRNILCWIACGPLLFCAYKYAMVRQTALPLMLIVIWIALFLGRMVASFRRAGIVASLVVCILMYGTSVVLYGSRAFSCASAGNFMRTCRPSAALDRCRSSEVEACAASGLPAQWLERIGTNRIMIVASEMGAAMSGNLNFVPFPATQDYSAYAPYLESLCIQRLDDRTRPVDFLLVPANPQTFDSRNVCLDNLRLWMFLKQHYQILLEDDRYVLLGRRPENNVSMSHISKDGHLVCPSSLWSRLRTLFWRAPRVMARVRYADGTENLFAANAGLLNGAPTPKFLPRTKGDAAKFFASGVPDLPEVESVTIDSP